MARPITVTVGPLAAASSTAFALAQAGTGGTPLTLNGASVTAGVALPDKARRLILSSVGDDRGINFAVVGRLQANGPLVTELLTGASGAPAQSALDWYSIASITPSGNTANNVTAGTNGVASSPWIRLDNYGAPPVALQVDVSGVVNYTVEQTLEDPNDPNFALGIAQLTWLAHAVLAAKTASQQDNYAYTPLFTRVTLNSGAGSCRFTAVQTYAPHRLHA